MPDVLDEVMRAIPNYPGILNSAFTDRAINNSMVMDEMLAALDEYNPQHGVDALKYQLWLSTREVQSDIQSNLAVLITLYGHLGATHVQGEMEVVLAAFNHVLLKTRTDKTA